MSNFFVNFYHAMQITFLGKVRKHFSYLVYEAQNLQALNTEKLHMQKPPRDVPQNM